MRRVPAPKLKKGVPKDAPASVTRSRARRAQGSRGKPESGIAQSCYASWVPALRASRALRGSRYSTPQTCLAAMRANVAVRPALMPVKLLG